jgi:serine/threonine protein kinase
MYIHSKKIVLKEVKPESILINKKGHIFLTGF